MKTWKQKLWAGALCAVALFGAVAFVHAEEDDDEAQEAAAGGVNSQQARNDAREGSFLSTYYQAAELRKAAAPQAAPWEPLGPYGVGRVNVAEVDPNNDQTLYVGAAGGG